MTETTELSGWGLFPELVKRQVEKAQAEYETQKTQFAKTLEVNACHAIEWDTAGVVKAQARWEIWLEMARLVSAQETAQEAKTTYVPNWERIFKRMVYNHFTQVAGTSFSTSQTSNLIEHYRRQEHARIFGRILDHCEDTGY